MLCHYKPKTDNSRLFLLSFYHFMMLAALILGFLLLFSQPAYSITGKTEPEAPEFIVSVGGTSGILIAPEWVLTARHTGQKLKAGAPVWLKEGSVKVETVYLSPNFKRDPSIPIPLSDIALVKLATPVKINSFPLLAQSISDAQKHTVNNSVASISGTMYVPNPSGPPTQTVDADGKIKYGPPLNKLIRQTGKNTVRLMIDSQQNIHFSVDALYGAMIESGNSGAALYLQNNIIIGIAHSVSRSKTGSGIGFFWFLGNDKDWITKTTNGAVKWKSIQ